MQKECGAIVGKAVTELSFTSLFAKCSPQSQGKVSSVQMKISSETAYEFCTVDISVSVTIRKKT